MGRRLPRDAGPDPAPERRNWAATGIVTVAASALALTGAELSVRLIEPIRFDKTYLVWDPWLHHRLRPDAVARVACDPSWDAEPFELRIGGDGFREYDVHPYADAPETIVFVGDSFVQGNCLADPETLPYQVVAHLHARLGEPRFGFRSLAVESYATCEEAALIEERRPAASYAILTIFPENDLVQNLWAAPRIGSAVGAVRYRSHLLGLGAWVVRGNAAAPPSRAEPRADVTAVVDSFFVGRKIELAESALRDIARSWLDLHAVYHSSDTTHASWRRALRGCLERFEAAAANAGARPIVVLIPARATVVPAFREAIRSAWVAGGLGDDGPSEEDTDALTSLVEGVARELALPLVDPRDSLRELGAAAYFPVDGHLSPAGTEALAWIIADTVEAHERRASAARPR